MAANLYLTDFEREKLERARVGIAGAGGLGSNVAMHLVRAGVRKFTIADFDVVNVSNLNRQFFFRDQVGMKKVEALKENLLRIEPCLEIELADIKLDDANTAEFFSACDIVVEAFDNVQSKAMLARAILGGGKTLVVASGLGGWGRSNEIKVGQLGPNIITVGDGSSAVGEDGANPESPRVGIVSAMQANAVVAKLLGLEP